MRYLKILSLSLIVALQSCLSADEDPIAIPPMTGSVVDADVGGATEPNQVWIDISDYKNPSTNNRTSWDLGFYNGDEFRIIMNGSIAMAVIKIPNATNINSVKESDVTSLMLTAQVGTFTSANLQYIDNPDGNFLTQTTGFESVKQNDAENPIYLVNLGKELPASNNIGAGSVSLSGSARGWKKVQILRANNGNGYRIRYADLNATSYQEYVIAKDTDYNFNFFNLKTGTPVNVQPKKKHWDIAFTTFTNEVFMAPGQSAGSYFYADFIITNTLSGVGAYQVDAANLDAAYNAFKLSDVDQSKFIFNDHRAIGDKWRTTTGTVANPTAFVYTDRFFVLKDAEGFYFKLRFNKMKDNNGNRGHANFEFEPL